MSRSLRRWLVLAVAAVLLVGSGGFAVARHYWTHRCGTHVQPVAAASSPFLDAPQRAVRPDAHRDRLVRAVSSWPAPFGPVVGAAGYDYDQYLHVASLPGGLGVWTRDSPEMAFLVDGRPRWGVRTDTRRSAWSAGGGRFLEIALPRRSAPSMVALSLADGRELWCARLGPQPIGRDDPLATDVLPGGDVAALSPGPPGQVWVSRLAGADGSLRWRRSVRAGGDFLGYLDHDTLVAGGVPAWRLGDSSWLADQSQRVTVSAVAAATGELRWTWESPAGTAVHVLGASAGRVVLTSWGPRGGEVLALDRHGMLAWSAEPFPGYHVDATVRAGRVLVRGHDRLAAYDAVTGRLLWQRSTRSSRQFFPYGFEIDSVPFLDERHVLLPTTTAVRSLDLDTGELSSYPLPRDGISTTWWPYQLAVTHRLVAVVTNTGAVLVGLAR